MIILMFAMLKKESKIIKDGLISPLSIAFYLNGSLLVFNFIVNDLTVFWHSSMKAISVRGKGGIGGGGIRNSTMNTKKTINETLSKYSKRKLGNILNTRRYTNRGNFL